MGFFIAKFRDASSRGDLLSDFGALADEISAPELPQRDRSRQGYLRDVPQHTSDSGSKDDGAVDCDTCCNTFRTVELVSCETPACSYSQCKFVLAGVPIWSNPFSLY